MRDYKNKLSDISHCSCNSLSGYSSNRDSYNWAHKDYHFSSCLLKNNNRLCFDGLLDIYNFMHDEMWILNLGENINNFRPLETTEFKDTRVSLYDFCLGYMDQSCENFTID